MAIVPDRSGNSPIGFGTDQPLVSFNRTGAGAPSSLTPQYVGEMYFDTTNQMRYRGYALATGAWEPAAVVG